MTVKSSGVDYVLVIRQSGRRFGNGFAMTSFSGELPPDAAGCWCRVVLLWPVDGAFWAKLEMSDSARGQIVREAFFPAGRGGRRTLLMHVPQASGGFSLSLFAARGGKEAAPVLSLQLLGRVAAAARLLAGGWRLLPGALRGNPLGLLGRARAMLGQGAARRGQSPPYPAWIDLYDNWGEQERHALMAGSADTVSVWVMDHGDGAAMAETMASVAAQWRQPDRVCAIRMHGDWPAPSTDWVVMLASGEVLAPQALACFARAALHDPLLMAIYADIDRYDTYKERIQPGFRPSPDPWLMRSELLRDGAWMFRGSMLAADTRLLETGDFRLALARRLPVARILHISLILSHCPMPAAAVPAPPALMPLKDKPWPRVSIIVPSACRSRHVLACLRRVARRTDYANFEILVAVSACDPADRRQARIMRELAKLPQVRLVNLEMDDFNFAAVINRAAARAEGEWLLLLNDDVSPISPDWLQTLVAFTQGAPSRRADIVGPRLLYGNGLVQHGGVIIGLANLCEHAFRLARRSDPGPEGIAHLDRQVSAVTAACMLVRRDLFESLNGLDEAFAIALNDVDFCLRAGQAGGCIVYASCVDMYHFESLSLGRHYHGARAGLEAAEIRRLRERWTFSINADPFYNPCASLELGREFTPGFPPRQTPILWIGQEAPAPH